MTVKIIRIVTVLFGVLASAIVLPGLVKTAFTSSSKVYISAAYSEVLCDFIITDYRFEKGGNAIKDGGTEYHDRKGNRYDKSELSLLMPLDNVSQLAFEGRFPDSLCGVRVTPALVSQEAFTMYYTAEPGEYYGLCELRDRKSYTSREMESSDLFRIGEKGIEFIVCSTNTVNKEKSRLFNDALTEQGFVPPAAFMWTPIDKTASEMLGYYVTDARGELYLLSMDMGRPVVGQLPLPDGKAIRNITFSRTPDFTALMITAEGDTYLQFPDGRYERLQLPDARGKSFTLSGNLFFRTFHYSDATERGTYVFDRQYRPVDSYTSITDVPATNSARIGKFLLPFTLRQTPWDGFCVSWSPVSCFIWLNLLLAAAMAFMFARRGRPLRDVFTIVDLLIIAIFGLYGLIGVAAFPHIGYRRQRQVSNVNNPPKNHD